ncbi:two-partner secretion domain-containing protein, partial [Vreelandella boliviensis]
MNRIYRTVWNAARGQWQVAPENVKRHGKTSRRSGIVGTLASLTAGSIILLPLCAFASGLPTGGEIRAGSGSIKQSGNAMRINQNSDRMAMDWDDFSVAEGHRVEFHQPGRDAAALNRVTGDQLSQIRGAIEANGQVFLVNPNGIVFGDTAQVDVGGLVASTLDISPDDFMAGDFTFEGNSSSAIINQGNIRAADEGYVALIATEIINEGSIKAPRGDVMMGAGSRVTLDMGGPIKIEVEEALLDTYIEQGGAIQADGGRVYLTAKAAGDLAASVINHTGTTQARTLAENAQGEIWLMGDMQSGETRVAGTLDASAPDGGDGGFVETSAAKVRFMDEVTVTTQAAQGKTGELLIDPSDYTVAPSGGDITGESLSDLLSRTTATLSTDEWGSGGNGDIFVNDEVSWSNSNQLTLNALRNIEINKTIQGGGKLVLKYGQANNGGEYQINAPIDLPAGQNFSTQLGSDDGNRINYTVITEYSSGSRTSLNNLQGTGSHLSGNYALGADIDASSTGSAWYNSWNPIGDHDSPFTGNFNGLSHTISDLNIDSDSDDYLGLFGSASSTSIIRDIGLVGGNIKGGTRLGGLVGFNAGDIINAYTTGSVNGTGRIGGLVGFNEGNIVRAHATGEATGSGRDVYDGWRVGGLVGHNIGTITHSYATGHVKGDIHAGGLVGSNTGTITKAYATGNVETPSSDGMFAGGLVGINDDGRITNAYATGDVVGDRNVGGLVGRNDTQAHNLVTIRNSYATGKATGNSDVGGLVGDGLGYVFRVVIDSYYATTRANGNPINGANSSGEGTGKSYAELTKLGTFRSAWGSDIDAHGGTDAVWRIYDGHTTPMLRSFLTPVTVTPDSNEIVGKVYDGDAASGIADYATDVSGATLDGNSLTYTTDAADAGTYDSLNFSGLYSHQQGYDISYDSAASVTIDSRPLTINGTTAQDKTYDGSTDATITVGTLNNLVAGEDLSVAATGSFSSADAGQRNVNARYILSNGNNGLASNYTTPTDSTHFATINKASLTVAAKDDSKTYDGQTYSGGNGVTYSGFVNNEGENKLGGSLAYRGTSQGATNANTYDIKPEGLSATNYDLTFESGKLTIDPRSLTISGTTVANKVYDGSTDATVTAGAMDNLATDENLSIDASGSFDNANAGSRTVTASYTLNDGTNGLANNY